MLNLYFSNIFTSEYFELLSLNTLSYHQDEPAYQISGSKVI